jgi:hypothetical protein
MNTKTASAGNDLYESIDLLVENEIILEVKSMDGSLPIHAAQILAI